MNILNVVATMDPVAGGLSQGIRNSIPQLNKLGIGSEVVCLDDPSASFLGTDTFPVNALGRSKGPWQYNQNLLPWLIDNLPRFDIVVANGLWLYQSYAVYKAIKHLKKLKKQSKAAFNIPKFLVMPHGMLDPYFQRADTRKIKAARNWLYWKLIEGKIVNSADGLLFTCESELLLARENFKPYHPKQEFNISYGVEPPPGYKPEMKSLFAEKCPLPADSTYILFLSRIHEKKGVDLLINAYISLIPHYSSIPKLVIAGPGLDTSLGEKLQKMVADSPEGEGNIFFTGMLTGDLKWGAIYGCEAFVLPSHQENFGIAVVEALACGKPVLISDQVNIWREMGDGAIVSKDTLEGTKEMLTQWLDLNLEDKIKMGKAARGIYLNNFDSLHAAHKFFDVLKTFGA